MATEFPWPVPEQGLTILGHPTKAASRAQAATWLQTARGLNEETAADAVDGVYVANDAWFSEHIVTDMLGNQIPATFCPPSFPGAFAVTVVVIPNVYLVSP